MFEYVRTLCSRFESGSTNPPPFSFIFMLLGRLLGTNMDPPLLLELLLEELSSATRLESCNINTSNHKPQYFMFYSNVKSKSEILLFWGIIKKGVIKVIKNRELSLSRPPSSDSSFPSDDKLRIFACFFAFAAK